MFGDLVDLGYGIIIFAVLIGVGSVVLFNFGGSVGCAGDAIQGVFNQSSGYCVNATAADISPSGTAYTNMNYLLGQLGSSGLSGWTPAIIAISIGLLFLGAFLVGKGRKRKGRY